MGIQKDLHMHGQDFAWTATAFFIGYIAAETPQGNIDAFAVISGG